MIERVVEAKYSIAAPSYRCRICAREVLPGETYYSAVLFEDNGLLRTEYCSRCWDAQPSEREAVYAFWRPRRPETLKEAPKRRRFDLDILWEFFARLDELFHRSQSLISDPSASPVARQPFELELGRTISDEQDIGTGDAPSVDDSSPLPGPPRQHIEDGDASGASIGDASVGGDVTGDSRERLLFLVALLLVRGKRLVLEATVTKKGQEFLKLSDKLRRQDPSPIVYWVRNPRLSREDFERVKGSLGDLLQMEI
jgi:hypothetical protein